MLTFSGKSFSNADQPRKLAIERKKTMVNAQNIVMAGILNNHVTFESANNQKDMRPQIRRKIGSAMLMVGVIGDWVLETLGVDWGESGMME